MKMRVVLVGFLLVAVLFSANAQFRLDAGVSVPLYVGNLGGSLYEIPYFIPIPELGVYYQFDLDMIKLGAGLRIPSLLIQSLLMPEIFMELNLEPFVMRASVSGGLFVTFGMLSQVTSQLGGEVQAFNAKPIFLPDISAGVKLWNVLQLTAGCIAWLNMENTAYIYIAPYINGRLVFVFGGDKKQE